MTDIRSVADPIDKKIYYPQTHYLAVIGLMDFINKLVDKKINMVKRIDDLKSVNTSGHFYFDENTLNIPENISSGYLNAVFIDKKNGIIEIMTTNKYLEVINGVFSNIKERT